MNRNSRILIECPCPSGWASDILSYNPNRNSRIFIESNILSYNPNRLSRILIESDILSYNPNRLSLFSRRKLWIRCICEEDQYRNFKSDLYIIKVEKEKNDDAFNLKEEIEMLKYLNNNRNAYPIMGFDYEFKSLNKVEKNEKRG